MKKLPIIALWASVIVAAYLIVGFIITPPFQIRGFYSSTSICGCGHRAIIWAKDQSIFACFSGHALKSHLGSISAENGHYILKSDDRNIPDLEIRPSFWGITVVDSEQSKNSFYPRDYFYPFSLLITANIE